MDQSGKNSVKKEAEHNLVTVPHNSIITQPEENEEITWHDDNDTKRQLNNDSARLQFSLYKGLSGPNVARKQPQSRRNNT